MSKRVVTRYTKDFKESSVKLAVESGQPISQTAKNLGVHVTTLHGWVKKYYSDKKSTKANDTAHDMDIKAEFKRLKKVLAKVTEERDILKKAAVDSIDQRNIIQYPQNYRSMMNGNTKPPRIFCTRS